MDYILLIIGIIIGAVVVFFIRKYKFEATKGVPQDKVDELVDKINNLNSEKSRSDEKILNLENNFIEAKTELTTAREKIPILQSELSKTKAEYENLKDAKIELTNANEKILSLQTELSKTQTEYENLKDAKSELITARKELLELQTQLTQTQSENKNFQEKLETQKSEIEQIQQKFKNEFENLANKIFEEKSNKFTEQNKMNISEILKPLDVKIKDFQKRVEETYDKESKQRFLLKDEIKKLYELNQTMTKETSNLTKALKGESKTQGNWGEFILEKILEKSGLIKGREFSVQESFTDEAGKRQRPDVIINLPDNKNMIIDSKLSLTAYERYCSSDNDEDRTKFLKEHILSLRNHIKDLSKKNYQNIYQINSLDFVLMFLPIEPAFGLAAQNDSNLSYEAFEKNIIIVSPSTLLATLRTIANIWRYEYQNKNALEIARQSGALYDKFVNFTKDLIEIGKKIDATQNSYESAMNKLSKGKGNLVKRVENLKEMGAKTTKVLSQTLLDNTEDIEVKQIEFEDEVNKIQDIESIFGTEKTKKEIKNLAKKVDDFIVKSKLPPPEKKRGKLPKGKPIKYIVKKGDTLWGLSEKFKGDGHNWPEVYNTNMEIITDPNLIYPGQEIIIISK